MLQKIYAVTITALVLAVVPVVTQAQTINMADALERMNTIIDEMEKLRAEFQVLATSVGQNQTTNVTSPTPAVLGAQTSAAVFTERLEFGETNDDIKRIQKLLATDPEIYPYGVTSGFFGPKTEEAIKNLQARNGWDTPGVVGPATRALLEDYFRAYPDENWPADVLKSAPPKAKVLGASTTNVEQQLADAMQKLATVKSQQTSTGSTGSTGANLAKEINVEFDDNEALVEIIYTNGNRKGLVADYDDEDEVIKYIAARTVLTEAMVREVIDFGKSGKKKSSSNSDGIDSIYVEVDDGESYVAVEYDNGDDDNFDVKEDREDKIIEAIADELNMDEGDVSDLVEFDYGDIDTMSARVDEEGGKTLVRVIYESGVERRLRLDVTDEDDITGEVADELDISVRGVKNYIEFN